MGLKPRFSKFLEKFFGGAPMKFAERFSNRRKFSNFYGFPPRMGIHEAVRQSDLVSIRNTILGIWHDWRVADDEYHNALSDYLKMLRDPDISEDDLILQNANVVSLQKAVEQLQGLIEEGKRLAIDGGYSEITSLFDEGIFQFVRRPENYLIVEG